MKDPKKILGFELKNSYAIDYHFIANDEFIKGINRDEALKNHHLYFLCKIRKIRYLLDRFSVKKNHIDMYWEVSGKGNYHFEFPLPKGVSVSIDEDESNSRILALKFKGKKELLYLPVKYIEEKLNSVGNSPEVLYIGHSLNLLKRLKTHEKIIKITSQLEDDFELRIFLNSLKFSYLKLLDKKSYLAIDDLRLNQERVHKNDIKNITKLSERILIHFFQPEYNIEHLNLNLDTDPLVKKLLKSQHIEMIGASYDIDNHIYDFWSKKQSLETKFFFFDFRDPEKGYQPIHF